jgi:D-inositol-3-phosphate glycosyltransferase
VNQTPLRIAMLSIHSSPLGKLGSRDTGGMSVYVRELSRELGRAGHRVDMFTQSNSTNPRPVLSLQANVRLMHLTDGDRTDLPKADLHAHLGGFFRSLDALRRREGTGYDLIHSHYWLSGRLGLEAQLRWKAPHVITFHTLGAVKNHTGVGDVESQLRLHTERMLARQCHGVLCATEKDREQLARHYGVAGDKTAVVPCGVDLERFRPMPKPAARRLLGWPIDETIALFVGRFDPLKGIDRLLGAFARLDARRYRLVLVGGDGKACGETRRLAAVAQGLGLEERVTFVGRVAHEKLPQYYSAADVLVIASHYESFGLVGLESLACGTPVVSTAVGAMDRIIRDGKTGYIVREDRPEAMAAAIEAVVAPAGGSPPAAETVRASVRDYSWARTAARVQEAYRQAIRRRQTEGLNHTDVPAHKGDCK